MQRFCHLLTFFTPIAGMRISAIIGYPLSRMPTILTIAGNRPSYSSGDRSMTYSGGYSGTAGYGMWLGQTASLK